MKNFLTTFLLGVIVLAFAAVPAQAQNAPQDITGYFTCPVFREIIADEFGSGPGGQIYYEDVAGVTDLWLHNPEITSLEGIQHFTSLELLDIAGGRITTLDLSNNRLLIWLSVDYVPLTSINISNNPHLADVAIYDTHLAQLDVSNLPALIELWVFSNRLTELDVSNNPNLHTLTVGDNRLTTLDISGNPRLRELSAWGNYLTELDLSNNPALTTLHVGGNRLATLDVSHINNLSSLIAWNNQLTILDVSNNHNLDVLIVWDNLMESHDDIIGWREIELTEVKPFHFEWHWDAAGWDDDNWPMTSPHTSPIHMGIEQVALSQEDMAALAGLDMTGYGVAETSRIPRGILLRNYHDNSPLLVFHYEGDIWIGPSAVRHIHHATSGDYVYIVHYTFQRTDPSQPPVFKLAVYDESGVSIHDFGGMIEVATPFARPHYWQPNGVHVLTQTVDGDIAWEMAAASVYWYGELLANPQRNQFFTVGHDFVSFPDLPQDHPLVMYVEVAASRRILHGFPDGNFLPDRYITRAEFAHLLYNALDLPPGSRSSGFEDVLPTSWFYNSVMTVYRAGGFDGVFSCESFNPSALLTHEEAWQIMSNMRVGTVPNPNDLDLEYYPDSYVTRAQAALYQLITLFYWYW